MTEQEYFDDHEASDNRIGEWYECTTCGGEGTIDMRLGGEWNSNPAATCPDCDGDGGRYIEAL